MSINQVVSAITTMLSMGGDTYIFNRLLVVVLEEGRFVKVVNAFFIGG
jgi:hypothetical protein